MNDESRPEGAAHESSAKTTTGTVAQHTDSLDDGALFGVELHSHDGIPGTATFIGPVVPPAIDDRIHRDLHRGLEAGLERRARGVQATTAASDATDKAVVDQAIEAFGRANGEVNANHMRPLLPKVRPDLVGARFLQLARFGELKEPGTSRPTTPKAAAA